MLAESVGELKQIVKAIYDRREETDAKLEALTMDVHHMKGGIAELKADVAGLKRDVAVLKQDVAELKKKGQERKESILQRLALRSTYESALRESAAPFIPTQHRNTSGPSL